MSKKQSAKAKQANKSISEALGNRGSIVLPQASAALEPEGLVDDDEDMLALDVNVTRETLEGTPVRVLTFLKAVGTSASIRASIAARGYRREDHMEGWKLLHAVSGYQDPEAPDDDTSVRDAIQQLDEWDEGGFQIVAATLKHRFPEQASFLLKGLKPATGAAAVLGVKQLLDRLDALETGEGRSATRETAQAALAILAQRGIDSTQRQRLRDLIKVAESAPEISLPDAQSAAKADAAHVKRLMALRAWFEEWSSITRVAIKRRDYLIRLGLARRHPKSPEPTTSAQANSAHMGTAAANLAAASGNATAGIANATAAMTNATPVSA